MKENSTIVQKRFRWRACACEKERASVASFFTCFSISVWWREQSAFDACANVHIIPTLLLCIVTLVVKGLMYKRKNVETSANMDRI